ncbi:hypothetical protein ARUE_c29570 [Arthrobacter sp. Rue61a]|nr:hypothetical protein ARUE_c29570 [Arthrobacter sp. Rue61a]
MQINDAQLRLGVLVQTFACLGLERLHIRRKGSSMNNSAAPMDRVPADRGVMR